jgi:hypothetical protein
MGQTLLDRAEIRNLPPRDFVERSVSPKDVMKATLKPTGDLYVHLGEGAKEKLVRSIRWGIDGGTLASAGRARRAS